MNIKKTKYKSFFASFGQTLITVLTVLMAQFAFAQVGIETTSPEAALDVSSTNSGILIPRVDLDATTDTSTVINPNGGSLVDGTMIWNTGAGLLTTSGYYFWENSKWNLVLSDKRSSVYFGKLLISSTGSITVVGVGFEPSYVEFTAINRVQDFNAGAYRSPTNNSNDVRIAGGMTTGYAFNGGGGVEHQTISNAFSGTSINNIGAYSSTSHCLAAYFVDNNGNPIHDDGTNSGPETQEGLVRASLSSFGSDGFTLNVDRFTGTATGTQSNTLVVIFKAYR